jgi:hypothetical protein
MKVPDELLLIDEDARIWAHVLRRFARTGPTATHWVTSLSIDAKDFRTMKWIEHQRRQRSIREHGYRRPIKRMRPLARLGMTT